MGYSSLILVQDWFSLLFMCIFQVNFSSRKTPRYLIAWSLLFHIMVWLFIFISVGFVYLFKVKIFISLLTGFNFSFHFANQVDTWYSEFCRSMIEVSRFLFCVMIAVSSAYIANSHSCGFGISWQKMLNSMGPRTDPCRIPVFTGCILEVSVAPICVPIYWSIY